MERVLRQWRMGRLGGAHTAMNNNVWPPAVSDGLTLPCSDCGKIPRFDFRVSDEFWQRWVPDNPARLSVICLVCLDSRCGGIGLAEALEEVQYLGNGFTVVLTPSLRVDHCTGVIESPNDR